MNSSIFHIYSIKDLLPRPKQEVIIDYLFNAINTNPNGVDAFSVGFQPAIPSLWIRFSNSESKNEIIRQVCNNVYKDIINGTIYIEDHAKQDALNNLIESQRKESTMPYYSEIMQYYNNFFIQSARYIELIGDVYSNTKTHTQKYDSESKTYTVSISIPREGQENFVKTGVINITDFVILPMVMASESFWFSKPATTNKNLSSLIFIRKDIYSLAYSRDKCKTYLKYGSIGQYQFLGGSKEAEFITNPLLKYNEHTKESKEFAEKFSEMIKTVNDTKLAVTNELQIAGYCFEYTGSRVSLTKAVNSKGCLISMKETKGPILLKKFLEDKDNLLELRSNDLSYTYGSVLYINKKYFAKAFKIQKSTASTRSSSVYYDIYTQNSRGGYGTNLIRLDEDKFKPFSQVLKECLTEEEYDEIILKLEITGNSSGKSF